MDLGLLIAYLGGSLFVTFLVAKTDMPLALKVAILAIWIGFGLSSRDVIMGL